MAMPTLMRPRLKKKTSAAPALRTSPDDFRRNACSGCGLAAIALCIALPPRPSCFGVAGYASTPRIEGQFVRRLQRRDSARNDPLMLTTVLLRLTVRVHRRGWRPA